MSVSVAFVVLGLLTMFYPAGNNGLNWIAAGVVAFLAGWWGMKMMKK